MLLCGDNGRVVARRLSGDCCLGVRRRAAKLRPLHGFQKNLGVGVVLCKVENGLCGNGKRPLVLNARLEGGNCSQFQVGRTDCASFSFDLKKNVIENGKRLLPADRSARKLNGTEELGGFAQELHDDLLLYYFSFFIFIIIGRTIL